jgi:hypothetical protein
MDYDLFSLILLVKKRGRVKQNSVRASRLKKLGSHLNETTPALTSQKYGGVVIILWNNPKNEILKKYLMILIYW